MDLHKHLGFVQIFEESIKIRKKNPKIMNSIVLLSFLFYSLFYFLVIFSIKPLINNLLLKFKDLSSTNPTNPNFFSLLLGIEKDSGILLGVEIIYFIMFLALSIVSISAIIFVTSSYYNGKVISFKEVLKNAIESCKRPFLTYFFVQLMSIGYILLFILVIMVPKLLFSNYPFASKSILIIFSIFALLLFIEFSVVWFLGIVVSVVEENCYGIQALGKAGRIIKGKKIDGFVLNLIFLVFYGLLWLLIVKQDWNNQIGWGITYWASMSCLLQLYHIPAYTVLYFECKKNHGEEIGEYSTLPTLPLVDEDIP